MPTHSTRTLSVQLRYPGGKDILELEPEDVCTRVGISADAGVMPALLIGAWTSLLMDSPVDDAKPRRTLLWVYRKAISDGLLDVIDRCSQIFDELVSSIWVREDVHVLPYLDVFEDLPIFREYLHWYRTEDSATFQFISSFLRFGKKCEFELEEFYGRALTGWRSVEDRLSNHNYPELTLRELELVVEALLPDPEPMDVFIGKHGPGAVAGDERGTLNKCAELRFSPKLLRLFSIAAPLKVPKGYYSEVALEREVRLENRSRLMFVPKNYKTARSICMEPTGVMYMQQHVRKTLERAISSSILRRFIQIDSQKRNEDGAAYGSRFNLVDTIDLSAASDSVSVNLLREVMPRKWLHSLLATRTSQVELPDGEVVEVHKYAPMGSALCFPVQSVLYCCMVVLAYLRASLGPRPVQELSAEEIRHFVLSKISTDWVTSTDWESIAVYGDDIICDTRVTPFVIDILEDLAFTVNLGKSFVDTQAYRESCGSFYLFGDDVTPFSFSAKMVSIQGFDARSLPSIIALANRAGDAGFTRLQSYLFHFLLGYGSNRGMNPILFSDNPQILRASESYLRKRVDEDYGANTKGLMLFSKSPKNTHLGIRWNEDLQREEYKCWILRPTKVVVQAQHSLDTAQFKTVELRLADQADRYWLDAYWRKCSLGESEPGILSGRLGERRGTKIGWGWKPVY